MGCRKVKGVCDGRSKGEKGGREGGKSGKVREEGIGRGRKGMGGGPFVERTRFPDFSGCVVDFFGNRDCIC